MRNIQAIVAERTGVTLPWEAGRSHAVRRALIIAAVLALCLSVSAYAYREFTSLEGDDLSLSAVYRGEGVVAVSVENRSDKTLRFLHDLKLCRWDTGEELSLRREELILAGTEFPPHTGGTMIIDLSHACDLAILEEPIPDWYYFVLTNRDFLFGQDWLCSVSFSPPAAVEAEQAAVSGVSEEDLSRIAEVLRPYFARIELDPETRSALNAEYAEQVRELLAEFDGAVVSPVSPMLVPEDPPENVVFDPGFTDEPQRVLTGLHLQPVDWNFKLLAAEGETAQVLSVMMPLGGSADAFRDMPILYVFTYEKAAVQEDAYAFIYGQLLSFRELERFKVWEDERYACYEVHELIYSDLEAHTREWLSYNTDVTYDAAIWQRVQNVYAYYRKNMSFRCADGTY